MGIDHQGDQELVVRCGGETAQRIDEADPVDVGMLTLGCLPHDQVHQMVNQRKRQQFFGHTIYCGVKRTSSGHCNCADLNALSLAR
jgi:hypothetical protein